MISKSFLSFSISAAVAMTAFSSTTQAQRLEETLITATLTEVTEHEALASVDVITEADMRRLQVIDIAESLNLLAGTDVVRSGGIGAPVALYTRGTNSGHTLMLINGQRFSSATLGTASFQLIDPAQLARSEFVRGSRSSQYGSDAIGGVMQMFTYDEKASPRNAVMLEAGSDELLRASLNSRGQVGQLHYSAGLSSIHSDGIDHTTDTSGTNGDTDGFESLSGSLFTGYHFNSGARLDLSYVYNGSTADYDNTFTPGSLPYREQAIQALQVGAHVPVTEHYQYRIDFGRSMDESTELDAAFPGKTYFDTTRDSIYWQNDWQATEWLLATGGIDFYDERVEASTDYAEDSRDNFAVFAQAQSETGPVDLLVGVRNDDNSSYGNKTTANVSAGYNFTQTYKLFASFAQGFKAPTLNDLYWPAGPYSAGNPDVKPEESDNLELGFKADQSFIAWQLNVYQNTVDNLIDWAPGEDSVWRPTNVAKAKIKGAEASASAQVYSFVFEGSASYNKAVDDETDQLLPLRAQHKYVVRIGQEFDGINYGVVATYNGKRDLYGDTLDNYILYDLYANVELADALVLGIKINNATDEDYVLNPGYNTEDRSFKANLTYTF